MTALRVSTTVEVSEGPSSLIRFMAGRPGTVIVHFEVGMGDTRMCSDIHLPTADARRLAVIIDQLCNER